MQVIERRVSFNGGEWSPWADARLDLDRYRSSCRTLENMRPTTYGGAFSRPGLMYVRAQDNATLPGRVVPFEFSANTNLVLLFTDKLMRPFTTGATPAIPQVTSPPVGNWVTAKAYAVGDWVRDLVSGNFYFCTIGAHLIRLCHRSGGEPLAADDRLQAGDSLCRQRARGAAIRAAE